MALFYILGNVLARAPVERFVRGVMAAAVPPALPSSVFPPPAMFVSVLVSFKTQIFLCIQAFHPVLMHFQVTTLCKHFFFFLRTKEKHGF